MPTISQLPPAAEPDPTDQLPLSQGGVSRAITVQSLLAATQPALTLASSTILGRASPGPGGPEPLALGTGLQIQNDVLLVDHAAYPLTEALNTASNVLLNDTTGAPQLMPVSLLRGLYTAGQNISIDADGTIHSTPSAATGNSIGAVAVGNALSINASGQLSVNIGTVSGTVAAGNDSRIANAEQTTNKNQPNGYAGIGANGQIPSNLLPPGVTSAVQSVNGQTGAVTLNASNLPGLGTVAAQNANAVALTGGSISGVDASAMQAAAAASAAVPRSLAQHFADVININDFGLARDGVTDDSVKFVAACQAAIAAQKKLYIPSGGPILLTDNAQQNVVNLSIFGDGIRDYDSPSGYGHEGSCLWFTGTTKTPFLLGPNVHFEGLNFFWPNQTEAATKNNNGLPIVYPPLFAQQTGQNVTYFNFVDCQVTNCYDFFTQTSTTAVVGGCTVERCIIYAINTCFTLINVPEVFFIANSLFTWGVYGSVVSVGPTYNLRTYTNTQGTWLKVTGNGTATQASSTIVGGIMSTNNYVYGSARGVWLAAGTLDISSFVNTSFDTVQTVLQGDTGCAMFSTRFTGGAWYPINFLQTLPDTTAIQINNPAPGGVGLNVSFSGITIPFVNGSLVSINGTNVSNLSFSDLRCNAFGHTPNGTGPYFGFQFNTPNANIRISNCDLQCSNGALSNTGVKITACAEALIANCVFRFLSPPIDVETASGVITLAGNLSQSTQGSSTVTGVGTTNVHDIGNIWDITNFTYNGFAPNNYRAGAQIGVMPVACSAASGYLGLQPSATGTGGGTRFGITALGTSPISLLTNAFNEEQLRVNRTVSAVNYVGIKGSVTGGTAVITTGGGDANSPIQLTGLASGATYLGSAGPAGSPVIRLGACADQSYVASAPASGFSITVPANSSLLLLRPAATLATGTVVLPAALADGEKIEIWSSKTITALTVTGAAGATVTNGTGFQLAANGSVVFFWNAANATWFQSLNSGTANGSIAGQNANNVAITGGSITGLSQFAVGNDAAVSASVVLDAAAGYARTLVYESTSLPRWVEGVQGNPENNLSVATTSNIPVGGTNVPLATVNGISTGMLVSATGIAPGTTVAALNGTAGVRLSQPTTGFINAGTQVLFYTNQGSDFAILPYDDTGAPLAPTLGQPLLITRATGQVTIKTLAVNGSANAPTPQAGDNSTQVATTAFVNGAIAANAIAPSRIGAAGGVAALDATGHVPAAQLPASVQGALSYQGVWNAATNTPTLASGMGQKGAYYTVGTAGATVLDSIGQWNVGDHAAFNGVAWEKLDGLTSEVVSVAGRTGAVSLTIADIAGLGGLAAQNANAVALTGGTIDGVVIGAASPAAASFSALQLPGQAGFLSASGTGQVTAATSIAASAISGLGSLALQSAAAAAITGGTIDGTVIGGTSAAAGNFSSLAASGAFTLGQATLTVPLYAGVVVQGGAAVLGSARGLGAFDGQQYRASPAQVASGQYAVQFGYQNTTAAPGAIAVGGSNSVTGTTGYAGAFGGSHAVSGGYAYAFGNSHTLAGTYAHAFGFRARDFGRYGISVLASGSNATNGDAQRGESVLRATSTTSAAVRLTTDGAAAGPANVLNLQNNQLAKLNIEITGFNSTASAAACWVARDLLLGRGASAAATTLSSTALTAGGTIGSVAAWTAPTIAADTSNGGLTINSGYAAGATIRWVARVVSIELM